MDRHSAALRLRHLAVAAGLTTSRLDPHMLATPRSQPCSTPEWTSATCRSLPDMPTRERPCGTTAPRKHLGRHPSYVLAAHMAAGT